MKKKPSLWYRKKGCELSKKIKRQQVGYCEICGKRFCKLEGHHLLTVGAYPQMSNQLENIIVLCVHCHKFGKISFHGSGTDLMAKKLEEKFPFKMARLREIARARKRVDYKAEYEALQAVDNSLLTEYN